MGSGIFNIGASLAEGDMQSSAARSQARFAVMQNETNAKFAEMQERDTLRRGKDMASARKAEASRTKSSTRAKMAAQGIDIDSGSAADVQSDIELAGELDAIQIENNAYREAFGFKVDASQSRFAAKIAQISGDFKARTTLLTSQGSAFGSAIGVASKAVGGGGTAFLGKG